MKQQVFRASAFLTAVAAVVFVVVISPGLLTSLFLRINDSLGVSPLAATPTPGPGSTRVSPADGMVMVFVPAGEFEMGTLYFESNEMPSHTVSLDAFWIDQTEVTNAMFAKFVEATGYRTDAEKKGNSSEINFTSPTEVIFRPVDGLTWSHPRGVDSDIAGRENHPVIHISWNDAREYCTWAGRRLPTEAEWEKAASWNEQAKEKTTYPWGNTLDGAQVNLCDQNCEIEQHMEPTMDDGYARTSPVGSFPGGASPYGALDMAGNAAEWVADWFGADYYSKSPISNPAGPETGETRVIRGGTWYTDGSWVRSGIRIGFAPDHSSYGTGIRCASSQ